MNSSTFFEIHQPVRVGGLSTFQFTTCLLDLCMPTGSQININKPFQRATTGAEIVHAILA